MNARTSPMLDDAQAPPLRQPPHSEEAEHAVLGALMQDSAALDAVLPHVQADSFWLRAHRIIFDAIAGLVLAGKAADQVSLFEHLRAAGRAEEVGGLPYLNELAQSVPSAANAARHAKIVAEKAAQRALIAAADKARQIAWGDGEVAGKIDRIVPAFTDLEKAVVMRKGPRPLSEVLAAAMDRYTEMAERRIQPGWRTGIAPLDRILGGGLRPGRLYGIAARPSVGKSSAARTIALSTATDGLPTLLLSQEMLVDEVADCIVSDRRNQATSESA